MSIRDNLGGGSSGAVLDTLEEIAANTESGKAAGALAVKELNNSLVKIINYIKEFMYSSTILLSKGADWGTSTTNSLSQSYTDFNTIKITWNSDTKFNLKVSEIELNKEYVINSVSDPDSYTKFKFTSQTSVTRIDSQHTGSILFEGITEIDLDI